MSTGTTAPPGPRLTGPAPTSTAPTSTAPTGRGLWDRARGPLLAALALVLVSIALVALRSTGDGGRLDPRAYEPAGSRAVAALLEDLGVAVRLVGDVPSLRAELEPDSTVLLPLPEELTDDELREVAGLGADLVVLGAGPAQVEALDLPVAPQPAAVEVRQPGCSVPVAAVAGAAPAGGVAYALEGPREGATGCYAADGAPTLVTFPARSLTLLGSGDPLTNDAVDREGAAALSLGLLGQGDEVLWLLPDAGRAVAGERRPLSELLPDAVVPAAVQVGVAVVLLALWRARRLGRVVTEPLPVVVRAAESVEGRGRLYRAAGARDTAAAALRAGARDRLARSLGLPPDADRTRLVGTLADRSGRPAGELDALLHGATPADDAGLVRLADALDELVAWQAPRPPPPPQHQHQPQDPYPAPREDPT